MKTPFKPPQRTALQAQYEAQKIAYAPIIFQVVRSMRDLGVLQALDQAGKEGISAQSLCDETGLSRYAIDTLLESGLSCEVVEQNDQEQFILSRIGWFLLHDEMTRINMDYNHYVCYKGLYALDESLLHQKPEGLKTFGEQWQTLYQALPHLPPAVQNSWYAFDHFYSDNSYPLALPILFEEPAQSLMDIGANVGKFSILAACHQPDLHITMLDLPDQLQIAMSRVEQAGLSGQIDGIAIDLLDSAAAIPGSADIFWLSQFLSCFGKDEIISILQRIRHAMHPNSRLFIMETCWDRQQHEAAAYALINTSPYFTCMASGNSKMYSTADLTGCINAAGLQVTQCHDHLGICHTLFEVRATA